MPNSNHQLKSPILTARSLSCIRGERTLFNDLGFKLNSGQCLHVVGTNGSGKTSLLRILIGINQSETGDITWRGAATHNNPNFLKECTYIGHKDGLKNELTPVENLSFYLKLNSSAKLNRIESDELIDDTLAKMGILGCADLSVSKLSFGQRRRLAFARLLITEFTLWVLDEPFTGVDVQGRKLIESICADHLNNNGMIILTNHQSLAQSQLADKLVELNL